MRLKLVTVTGAIAALLIASGGTAEASAGPKGLQKLAQAQTQLLFAQYFGAPQTASPASCNQGQRPDGIRGVFLLPTLSFGTGDALFICHIKTRSVLLDLGGAIATEDSHLDGAFTTHTGEKLLFTRANLERICDDILLFPANAGAPPASPATLDGKPITGTPVSTPPVTVTVNPTAGSFFSDSIAVGHPGKLAASYCGTKAQIRLTPGQHVIQIDQTLRAGGPNHEPTHFTYAITVQSDG
jgi:hypothetical protein